MIYTAGKELLTRPQLHDIPIPPRDNVSNVWAGVNHGDLADAIVSYTTRLGFGVHSETWYTNPSKSALFGAVDIDTEGTDFNLDVSTPSRFSLGVRHDNLGRYAVTLAVGARVVVCSNGVFSGEFVLKSRHTNNLVLEDAVADGIEEYVQQMEQVQYFIQGMQMIPLQNPDAAHILLNSLSTPQNPNGPIPPTYAGKIWDQWRTPTHWEFQERNEWSFYNACTQVAKEMSPPNQIRLLKGLKPMMIEFAQKASLTMSLN